MPSAVGGLMTARWGIGFGAGIALITAIVHILAVETGGWLAVLWWLTPTFHLIALTWIWSGPHIVLPVIASVWLGRGTTGRVASVRMLLLGVLCGLVAVAIYLPMFGLARTPSVLMHGMPDVLSMLIYLVFFFFPGPLCLVLVWAAKRNASIRMKAVQAHEKAAGADPVLLSQHD